MHPSTIILISMQQLIQLIACSRSATHMIRLAHQCPPIRIKHTQIKQVLEWTPLLLSCILRISRIAPPTFLFISQFRKTGMCVQRMICVSIQLSLHSMVFWGQLSSALWALLSNHPCETTPIAISKVNLSSITRMRQKSTERILLV